MTRILRIAGVLSALAWFAPICTQPASAGTLLYNPIVDYYGDGSNTGAVGVTTSVNLYYASVGGQTSPVSSATFPSSSPGGAGNNLVTSANNSAEGALANNPTLAADAVAGVSYSGTGYAYLAGYDTTDGSATSAANRSVGVVTVGSTPSPSQLSGATVLQTQTAATCYEGSTIRSAVAPVDTAPVAGSTPIYTSGAYGTGDAPTAGWRNFTTNTQLWTSTPASGTGWANTRTTRQFGSQLFGSMSSGGTVGVYAINPSAGTATAATSYIDVGTSSTNSPYEFVLFDNPANSSTSLGYNVAYIADAGNVTQAAAGIEKWVYSSVSGGTWTEAYVIKDSNLATLPGTPTGYYGLAGEADGSGNAVLFATTSNALGSAGSTLEQVSDPLSATSLPAGEDSSFTVLATAPADYGFRGVALAPAAAVPEPSTFALAAIGAVMGLAAFARRLRRSA